MRKLTDDNNNELKNSKRIHAEIDKELVDLGNRVDENKAAIDETNKRIDEMANSDTIDKQYGQFDQTDTGSLFVKDEAQIDGSLNVNETITAQTVETGNLESANSKLDNVLSERIRTNELEATNTKTETLTSDSVESKTVTAGEVNADAGTFGELNIDKAIIENFEIVHADMSSLKVAEDAEIEGTVTAPKAKLSDIASEIIRSDIARLDSIQTHNIHFDNLPDNPYFIHIEPQDQPSATDYRIIEVPYCDTGDYVLTLRDPVTDIAWWSVIIRNNNSNITLSYSRRTTDLQGNPMVNPTLSQVYLYDYDSQAPQIYLKTYVGGNLYWQNQSLRDCPEPIMWNEYPFDISQFGALRYDVYHIAATWFTHHVDIGAGNSLGAASLFLIPSDWANATRQQLEYNTERDIPYRYYIPDQSLDTSDEVAFAELVIEPLEGRWVYSVENSIKGRDGVIITDGDYGKQKYDEDGKPEPVIGDKDAGQLNEFPWVIETEQLAKWNGKTGVRVNVDRTIDATIYRDQAYEHLADNQYIYRKVDIDSYDVCKYAGDPTTVNNVLVYMRKHDTMRGKKYDLVVSAPAVKSEYEDTDQIMWDCYTYTFYGEYPSGLMYTKIIERMENGELIHRILETTTDSNEYILNPVEFKEDFSFGDTILTVYTFDNYKKDFIYLGDVVEGRWNAGEIHAHKKNVDPLSSDYTGSDYDYSGNLTIDGKTNLRDSIKIINNYDQSDIKPVEEIDTTVDNIKSIITTKVETTIGTEDDPATIEKTTFAETTINNTGDITITNKGDKTINNEGATTIENIGKTEITNTGDFKAESDGNVEIEINGNIEKKYTGHNTTKGPSENAYHDKYDDPDAIADWNETIIENTQIGTDDDNRDLRVTGRLLVNEIDFDCADNQILYKEDMKMKAVANSFIGTEAKYDKMKPTISNGSLIINL